MSGVAWLEDKEMVLLVKQGEIPGQPGPAGGTSGSDSSAIIMPCFILPGMDHVRGSSCRCVLYQLPFFVWGESGASCPELNGIYI